MANDDKRIKLKPLMAVILQYLSGKSEKEIMMIYGNTVKEIIKTYPKWVWAGNIFCLALGLWVIFWL